MNGTTDPMAAIMATIPDRKQLRDMRVTSNTAMGTRYSLLKLTPADNQPMPRVLPGQFVQVAVPGSTETMLSRPISVNYYDADKRELSLLVARAGRATDILADIAADTSINILFPLGNTFPLTDLDGRTVTLIGGGVGTAPLLYYAAWLRANTKADVNIVLAARTADDVLMFDRFAAHGAMAVTTDDGTMGAKGFATDSPMLTQGPADIWCVCGPAPMMKAVTALARKRGAECHASLENMMACGLGACLCCVEKTVKGNVCVCTYGPVFNTDELNW